LIKKEKNKSVLLAETHQIRHLLFPQQVGFAKIHKSDWLKIEEIQIHLFRLLIQVLQWLA